MQKFDILLSFQDIFTKFGGHLHMETSHSSAEKDYLVTARPKWHWISYLEVLGEIKALNMFLRPTSGSYSSEWSNDCWKYIKSEFSRRLD